MSTPASSAAPGAAFPPPRVVPNARHAWAGIWRLTSRRLTAPVHWAIVGGMLVFLIIASIPVAPTPAAAAQGFLPWANRFYLCFVVPLLAFIGAGGAMRDDLQAETVDYIFTRPISRPRFITFRYLAHVICTQIDFLLALGVVLGIGTYHHVPGLWTAAPWLLLAQFLVIIAFTGFGFLCAMLTSRYVILGLLYGAIVEVGLGNVPTQLNRISLSRHVASMLGPVTGENVPAGVALAPDPVLTVLILLGFAIVTLALAALLFQQREFAGAGHREP
jgi:ABC-2 type transport system permease protein